MNDERVGSPGVTTAAGRFEIVVETPSRLRLLLRSAMLVLWSAVNLGDGPTNPGGRRARIVDRRTNRTVGELHERLGDPAGGEIAEAVSDLERLDDASFATRWIS